MVWGRSARKPAADDAVVGLDLNSARVRGAIGTPPVPPRALLLTGSSDRLPLAIDLEPRTPKVEPSALGHRRRSPHLLCSNFLPALGEPRTWSVGRNRIDATAALTLIGESIRPAVGATKTVYLTLPGYLSATQIKVARAALEAAKLPIAGSCHLPLAIASWSGPRRGSVLVLDIDDSVATWSLIADDTKQLRLIGSVSVPQFGRMAWIDRLMDAAADQCIRVCRRDPRDSAAAEQALDDQVSDYLAKDRDGQSLSLDVRTEHWFQNIVFSPDEVERACAGPIRAVIDAARPLLESATTPPEGLLVTSSAARLPGLITLAGVRLPERTVIEELPAGAPAEAAYGLAVRRSRGELPAGHLDSVLPRLEPAVERARV